MKPAKLLGIFIFVFFCIGFFSNVNFVEASTINASQRLKLNSGLVGLWSFDGKDVVNGVAMDRSGNSNSGNLLNIATSTFYTRGKIGQAFNFDGSDDAVNIPNENSFDITPTGSFTISAWIYPQNTSEFGIWNKYSSTPNGYKWYLNGNTMNFYAYSTSFTDKWGSLSSPTFSVNQWYHVVWVVNGGIVGGTVKFYINGVAYNTTASGGNMTSGHTLANTTAPKIGGRNDSSSERASGSIDEVRFYNRALSATEVTALYKMGVGTLLKTASPINSSGLVGLWSFDSADISSGVALDRSGNARNANLFNIATSSFYVFGKVGQAFNFDGSNDYVSIPAAAVSALSSGSISFWVNPNNTNEGAILSFGKESAALPYMTVEYSKTGNGTKNFGFIVQSASDGDSYHTNSTFDPFKWHHVALIQTGSGWSVYVNGVFQTLVDDDGIGSPGNKFFSSVTGGDNFRLGNLRSNGVTSLPFNGMIDDLRIYNRALSASEVLALSKVYTLKANSSQALKLTAGLIGQWSFDGKDVVNGVALDRSGNGNSGNLRNVATSTFYTSGKNGQAFNFDGQNDFVNLGTPASLAATGAVTVSAWIKTSSAGGNKSIIHDAAVSGTHGSYGLDLISGKLRFVWSNGSTGAAFDSTDPIEEVGLWQHVVGVRDSSRNVTLYVNGASVAGSFVSGGTSIVPLGLQGLTIGRVGVADSQYFVGSIDEVRVYNRALAASEVTSLYNAGRGPIEVSRIAGTGGTMTTVGGDTVHTFTTSGTFVASGSGYAQVLVVAGGGGGGQWVGGGGGGGGVLYNTTYRIIPGTYTVTVGGGGAGGTGGGTSGNAARGQNGQNSVFGSLTAIGGGGGGAYNSANNNTPSSGGSGGGGGAQGSTCVIGSTCPAGGTGTAGQGYDGGVIGSVSYGGHGSGGGGAGAVGGNWVLGTRGGNGGIGVANSITGSSVYYGGGGGGGGGNMQAGTGGTGGGGCGAAGNSTVTACGGTNAIATAGTANTGGGGGGGGNNGVAAGVGKDGGSGIVIIRYTTWP